MMSSESNMKAVVDRARCYGCGACTTVCIPGAIAIVAYKAVVDPEKCTGCGRCVEKCAVGVMSMETPR
jgi:ferredoxin